MSGFGTPTERTRPHEATIIRRVISEDPRATYYGHGGNAYVGGVTGHRPNDRASRAQDSPRADGETGDHDRAGTQLRTLLDAHVTSQVSVGVKRDQIFDDVV